MNKDLCRDIEIVERYPQSLAFFKSVVIEARSLDNILKDNAGRLKDKESEITALARDTLNAVHLTLHKTLEILLDVKSVSRRTQEDCEELGRDLVDIVCFIDTFSDIVPSPRESEAIFLAILRHRSTLLKTLKRLKIAKDGDELVEDVYEREMNYGSWKSEKEASATGADEVNYQPKSGKASEPTRGGSNERKDSDSEVQPHRPAGKGTTAIESSPYYARHLAMSRSKSGQKQDFVAPSSRKLEDVIDVSDGEEDQPAAGKSLYSSEDNKRVGAQASHRSSIGTYQNIWSQKREKGQGHWLPTQMVDVEGECPKAKPSLGRKSATGDNVTSTYAKLQNEKRMREEDITARRKGKPSKSGKATTLDHSFRGRNEGPSRRFEDPQSYLEGDEYEEPEAIKDRASTMPANPPPPYTAEPIRSETLFPTNFLPQSPGGPYPFYGIHPSTQWLPFLPMSPPATAIEGTIPTSVTTNIKDSFNVYGNERADRSTRPARRQSAWR